MRLDSKITPGVVHGPYIGDGRRVVTIVLDGRKRSMTYARWLMQEHLGRVLEPHEHVHHRDEDPFHDEISNYEIKTPQEHHREHQGDPEMVMITCALCGAQVEKLARWVRHNLKQSKAGPFCGRVCAGKHNAAKRYTSVRGETATALA